MYDRTPDPLRSGLSRAGRSYCGLLLTGEAGVGKRAIVEAAHRRWFPTGHLAIVEADGSVDSSWLEQLRPLLLDAAATVVVRHVDRLSTGGRRTLAEVLDGQPGEGPAPWLVATSASAELDVLLDAFPLAVAVPPLRHHLDDIRDLVPALAPNRS